MFKQIRRWNLFFCNCLVLGSILISFSGAQPVRAELPAMSTHARAASLIDVNSGRILYSHRGDERMLIASLTKIMTAIIALEYGKLDDIVKVSPAAYGKEGSSIYLRLGEEMSLHHLLYGLMLRSGNDAAVAIAEHVGGSIEGFAFLMNQKAQELGMTNTNFTNPHGLDDPNHYSTANDLAKLTAYALKNEQFQEIVKTKVKRVPNPNDPWDYIWHNKNKMLNLYEGADGVKTGYTKAAGRGLVSSATRGGRQLVVVTLNDPVDWADHAKLLDYGFEHFSLKKIVQRGMKIQAEQPAAANDRKKSADTVIAGKDFYYPLTESEEKQITYHVQWETEGTLDYKLGLAGLLHVQLGGSNIGQIPLYRMDSPAAKRMNAAHDAFRSSSKLKQYRQIVSHVVRSLFSW